jgi:hypothetical protein
MVRRVFDGNPLYWIINDKNLNRFGVGTFSLHEKCYFESFQQSPELIVESNPPKYRLINEDNKQAYNFKVNCYPTSKIGVLFGIMITP